MSQVWTRKRAGTAESPTLPIRQPVSARPEIHLIELPLDWAPGSTQVYLIEGQPLTLIDTGVRSAASRAVLEEALASLGHALGDVERIVVTHGHRDHFGLVESIRREAGDLECCAHDEDADRIEHFHDFVGAQVEAMDAFLRAYGVPSESRRAVVEARRRDLEVDAAEAEATRVDRRLREGDRLGWKDWAVEVLHVPGHSPGHMALFDESAGLLFTGDLVMGHAVPHAENFELAGLPDPDDALHRAPRFKGLRLMRRSLRRLRALPVKIALPGYGGVLVRPERAIRDTLLHYDVRLQRIERSLRNLAAMGQEVTAFELGQALFPPDDDPEALFVQLLTLIGAIDCLEEDGLLVTERRDDGVLVHRHA